MSEKNDICFSPIGLIRTPFKETKDMPIQPSRAGGVRGTVEIFEKFKSGLSDLEGFSHVILLYHLHRSRPYRLKVIPFLDREERGLFSTRAPSRPNPIGLSVVSLVDIDDNIMTIENVDMLDGTPLLDIKPYVGEFDHRTGIRCGWLDEVRGKSVRSDDRFGESKS